MAILAVLLAVLGFLVFPSNVYAEFTFTIPQTTITDVQEIDASVNLSLQGQGNKTYYLEGALKKEGSTNYFGLTWNDSSWVKYTANNYTTLKSITLYSTGKWNGIVKVKIDKSSSLFTGDGNYTLRMKRFTSSGSNYWADNDIALTVILPSSPTSTPVSTPTPSTSTGSTSSSASSSFTISNTPSQINSDQSFSVSINLSLPNNPNANFYLKGAFKKAGSSNYFGLTKVNSSWIKSGSTYSNQYPITTDSSGNWSGNIEVQPDNEDSGFSGSGEYIFKVGRYTSTGSGPTWSNESNIQIAALENTDQDSVSSDNSSSTTIPSSSPKSGQSAKTKSSSQSKSSNKLAYHSATVAAATTSASPSTKEVKTQRNASNFISWIGTGLILTGISLLAYIYLRSRGFYETISNLFRKRD